MSSSPAGAPKRSMMSWVPAPYGVCGIQSFIVNHRGVVHARNLGPDTMRIARGITGFDPGPGWTAVAP